MDNNNMKIKLQTYSGNTVYSIYTEKYGKEYHLGYIQADKINSLLQDLELQKQHDNIKKPCPEAERLAKAINSMIKQDKTYFTGHLGAHRDGLD
jgi:hypothetical protein|tara:strand:+ start:159 stop:440 length:282 start_codon:yes stop_codon:yes gene_type:complete